MSDRDRSPWWFSGDEQESAEPSMAQTWPAGDARPDTDAPPEDDAEPDADAGPTAGMDWSLLVAGAQRMVDWATERVVAPHAEHEDPAEHPQCLVCRTIVLVGDTGGLRPGGATAAGPAAAEPPQQPTAIRWIPIRDGDDEPAERPRD
jgi:hypothetical protein